MKQTSIRWFIPVLAAVAVFGLCGCGTPAPSGSVAGGAEVTTGYQPIQSDLIYSVNYDAAGRLLTVVLYEDGVYDYADVPAEVYEGLLKAGDRDQYYSETIKKGYKGTKFTME